MPTSYSQILVHLDVTARATERLRLARELGSRHGAQVTALYAATPSLVEMPFTPEIGASVAADMRAIDEGRVVRARAAFDDERIKPGALAAWAQVLESPVMGVFARQALHADLLVLGQHNPSSALDENVPADFVEGVLALSGKPALVLPYIGAPKTLGGVVAVAWKPTRESARAVAGAMPLLQGATQVHVISWGEDSGADPSVEGARLDLNTWLKAQGVTPLWHRQSKEPEAIGDLLLSLAFDLGADLLVMGCYGHSRAREWVLGGVSRTVLRSMTLPVLMAH